MTLCAGCTEAPLPAVPTVVERPDAPSLLAEETCRSLFVCGCPDHPYRDRAHCREVLERRGRDMDQVAAAADLHYDGTCVSSIANTLRELGCEVRAERPPCIPCRPFFGSGALGQPCEKLGVTVDVDTCGQGLRCEDRICVELCPATPILGLDERCAAGIEQLGTCEAGMHCDDATQRCTASPTVGQPCPERVCTEDAWCDLVAPDGPTCVTRRDVGDDCFSHEVCESRICTDGRCAEPESSVCAWLGS